MPGWLTEILGVSAQQLCPGLSSGQRRTLQPHRDSLLGYGQMSELNLRSGSLPFVHHVT